MTAAHFTKPSLRPHIVEILNMQSPLHGHIIHTRIEAKLGHNITRASVNAELSRMVQDGELRRAGVALYARREK